MRKILLVDDHPDILRLLEMSLKSEGYTIFTAANGRDGLEATRRERPDLVILDVKMPELDGYRVLSRIKSDPDLCRTVVVMLTVQDQPEDMALGLEIGADYSPPKPFRPDDVCHLVRRIFSTGVAE